MVQKYQLHNKCVTQHRREINVNNEREKYNSCSNAIRGNSITTRADLQKASIQYVCDNIDGDNV